jgi:hypothetical protein
VEVAQTERFRINIWRMDRRTKVPTRRILPRKKERCHASRNNHSDRPCGRPAISPSEAGTRSGGNYVSWKLAQLARALPSQLLRLRQPPFRILVRLLVLPRLPLPVSWMVAHLHRRRHHAVAGSRRTKRLYWDERRLDGPNLGGSFLGVTANGGAAPAFRSLQPFLEGR